MAGEDSPVLGSQGRTALASNVPRFSKLPQQAGEASQGDDSPVLDSRTAPVSKPGVPQFLELPQPAGEATKF